MTDPPKRPADPRPNDQPYYITTTCPDCDTPLELWDRWYPTDGPFWYDEWVCPACLDRCFLDIPESDWDSLPVSPEDIADESVPLDPAGGSGV